jgi:hypothetical protein
MEVLDVATARRAFGRLFDQAHLTMFKAEVLQDYSAIDDSPSLRAWADGDTGLARQLAATDADIAAWRNRCLESPADITRVHLITEPLTTYLEWEIELIYKGSLLRYGAEDVRLFRSEEVSQMHIPDGDFWIFDDRQVLEWIYDAAGFVAGGKLWADGEDVTYFLQLKQQLLVNADPVL